MASLKWLAGAALGSLLSVSPALAQTIAAGPMVGATTPNQAHIWVKTTQPATVQVYFAPEGQSLQLSTSMVKSQDSTFLTAQVTLTQLKPNTRYHYQVWLNGKAQTRPYTTTFQTPPLPGQEQDFTVAFGSCLFVQGALMNALGIRYGEGHRILETIDQRFPDLMLWLGDNVYMNPIESASLAGINEAYSYTRGIPAMQALLARRPNYSIWDDHDYGPNNGDTHSPIKKDVLKVFQHYWANPAYGTATAPGVYYRFQWADVDFFMMDDRYYRGSNTLEDPGKPFLGTAQLDWLQQHLRQSKATFKMIAIGNQVLNDYTHAESYPQYPQEHEHLLNWLRDNQISGVVFLSGDRHHAELIKVTGKTAYPLYDFTSSPLTSRPLGIGREQNNPRRVKDTLIAQDRSYGMLSFEGKGAQRLLRMGSYNVDGKKFWEFVIKASELR